MVIDMDRYEKINNSINDNVYGLDLYYGKIGSKPGHNTLFYYIVENSNDDEFVEKEALKMLTGFGKTYYGFYGKYESKWHIAFDEADITVFGEDKDVAMTVGYVSLKEMAEDILMEMHVRSFIPCNIYIIYDDEKLYMELKEFLNDKELIANLY